MKFSPYTEQISQWHLLTGRFIDDLPTYLNEFINQLNAHGFSIRYATLSCKSLEPIFQLEVFNWVCQELADERNHRLNVEKDERIADFSDAIIIVQTVNHSAMQEKNDGQSLIFDYSKERQWIKKDPNLLAHPLGLGDGKKDDRGYDVLNLSLKNTDMPSNRLMLASALSNGMTAQHHYDLELLSSLISSYVAEFLHHRSINQFMSIYLGQDIAKKVLKGQVARGKVQQIEAAIWFSNVDPLNVLSDDYLPEKHLGELNSYYHQLINLIESNGGQVLKFMGDGMLAMFEGDQSCHLALEAAVESLKVKHAFKHSVSLHYGHFDFGNIGSDHRSDFTAIGPQIQLASKIQQVAEHLDCALLGSDAFAQKVQGCLKPLGYYRLQGVQSLQLLYALTSFSPQAN